ncbi:hypothetical protein D9756_006266 [Leucocoprinus leucothites]|uniref:Transcription termination and cleavage factor C-terminal domain-containing protein n=1 Tax=Leucocoprinus leucothites TaxID=201217 RepID=A0A8H5D2Z0_9AGAR|nr:hypothetical protein D9756_006266 [Leucoagaricus leucothites]
MADQSNTEQLLELLVQLKKTTPEAARGILSSQPAIAYALIRLMVSVGAINVEVFQKTLAQYHESNARAQPTPSVPPVPPAAASTPPISALPPHLQSQYRTSTPPTNAPTPPVGAYGYPGQPGYAPPQGYPQPGGSTPGYASYGAQPQPQPGYPSYPPQAGPSPGYSAPPPSAAAGGRSQSGSAVRPDMLTAFPEDQKALIMHVVSMTSEQLNSLPPEQRNTYMQIRATLGIH